MMNITGNELVKMAKNVATRGDFDRLRAALDGAGAHFERPVGDLQGNLSAISASGDPEHLVLELITNGQDALLERQAAAIRASGESVPSTPRDLAKVLGWPGQTDANRTLAQQIQLSFRDSGYPERPTICVRDKGVGIADSQVRKTILSLSQAPKNHKSYLLGNYGKGGSTMYRDGMGAVLIGRPSPELIQETGCEDRVWVAAIDAIHDNGKIDRWTYLVTTEFDPDRPADTGPLLSFDADGIDFAPGVMSIHIAYAAPGLGKASILRDRKSIYVLGNTRLFDPVLPWSIVDDRPDPLKSHKGFRSMYGSRSNFISGEQRQLRGSGFGGTLVVNDPDGDGAYDLPITVFLFDPKSRFSATAADHVVIFTLNGQVQAHWGHVDTRNRTAEAGRTISGLRRVAQSVLFVDVGLDHLPPRKRSKVVSVDRTQFTDVPLAKAIEHEVARWLAMQPSLQELEKELALERSRSTGRVEVKSKILDEIARRLGFRGSASAQQRPPGPPKPPPVLLSEPTELSGHATTSVVIGQTRTIHFALNGQDGFLSDRAAEVDLVVEGLKLGVEPSASSLRRGRFSLELLADDASSPGTYDARVSVRFLARAGGVKTLEWPFKLTVLSEAPTPPQKSERKRQGRRPVVVWQDDELTKVGDVNDEFTGAELAELDDKFVELSGIGEDRVTVIEVNPEYLPIRQYLDAVARASGDQTIERRKDRYLVGVAVALSRVFGVLPGSSDDEFPGFGADERADALRLAADSIVASLPPAETS